MASILQIGDSFRAQIRRSGHKPITRTFSSREAAAAWARDTEEELDKQAQKAAGPLRRDFTVGDMVEEYRKLRESLGRPVDPTSNTHYMLNHLDTDLGRERSARNSARHVACKEVCMLTTVSSDRWAAVSETPH